MLVWYIYMLQSDYRQSTVFNTSPTLSVSSLSNPLRQGLSWSPFFSEDPEPQGSNRQVVSGGGEICNLAMSSPGFPSGSAGKESACNEGDVSSIPGLGRSPGEGKGHPRQYSWASLVAQLVKNPSAIQETWVQSLGWKRSPGEGYPLQYPGLENSMDYIPHGVTKSGHDWATFTSHVFTTLLSLPGSQMDRHSPAGGPNLH